ncbi:MAG: FAD-dependent oxidoreductase [Pseudomonadales bacterium]
MTGALYRCPIIRCVPLSNARAHAQPVQEIVLEAPPGFSFRAGQYTQVEHLEGLIPLSIASGPRRLPTVTLHYRSLPGVPAARWMDELLAAGEPLLLHAPAGDVQMPDDSRQPIVMIVGGTGITQALAVLDELADVSERAPVDLLWCADSADDFYCRHALDALAASWLRVRYTVDPRRTPDNSAFEQARNLLSSSRTAAPWILLGGSPSFVYAMDEALATVTRTPRHADAFSWAPRPTQQDL